MSAVPTTNKETFYAMAFGAMLWDLAGPWAVLILLAIGVAAVIADEFKKRSEPQNGSTK
jgi:hypothetical protein